MTRASPPAASESVEGDNRTKRNAELQSTVRTQSREAVTQAEARIRGAVAERFLIDLKERLAKFALSLHPEKTRLLEFGRYAAERRAERGQGKPETFDFLGLTHYCTTRKDGTDFQLGRKTQRKRMKASSGRDQGDTTTAQAYADRRAGTVALVAHARICAGCALEAR